MSFHWSVCLAVTIVTALSNAQRIHLDLHRHQSCPWTNGTSSWNRKLLFEGGQRGQGARLIENPKKPGCYSIKGKAAVFEPIIDDLTVYMTISTSGDTSVPPEPCRDPDPDTGCGGIGSCAYCRPCEGLNVDHNENNPIGAELLVGGRQIGCEVLKPGKYDDVQLRFCLPQLSALLQWQHIDERTFRTLLNASAKNQNEPAKLNIFATVYFFDRNIRPLIASQRKLEVRLKEVRRIAAGDSLDPSTYWSLPFNQLIHRQRTFIGCHKLYGTVTFSDAK